MLRRPRLARAVRASRRAVITFAVIIAIGLAVLGGYALGARTRTKAAAAPAMPARSMAQPPRDSEEEERVASEKARIIRSRDAEAAALRRELVDRDASQIEAVALIRERAKLFRQLADVRGETACYRQLVIDIEDHAPPPILAGVGEPDDLKLIVGIGPVLERMLHNLGVTQFRQIARWTERDAAEFDAKLPEFPGRIQRDHWVTQARELHQSKYGERP